MLSIYAACCITAMPSTGDSAVTNELVVVANLILLSRQSAKKEGFKVRCAQPSSWRQKGSGATSMGKTGTWHTQTWKHMERTEKFGQGMLACADIRTPGKVICTFDMVDYLSITLFNQLYLYVFCVTWCLFFLITQLNHSRAQTPHSPL